VLLAYLHALADVNCLTLSPWNCVHLTRRAENTCFGLKNGILDQTTIIFGQQHHLIHIDTLREQVEPLRAYGFEDRYRIVVAYSCSSRELLSTGYNARVQECREAAAALGRLAGIASAEILSDVPEKAFNSHCSALPDHLRRRAMHFITEVRRVRAGTDAWRSGAFADFGALMRESCRSSIEQYECGSTANGNRLGALADLKLAFDAAGTPCRAVVAAGDNLFRFSLAPLWQRFLEQDAHCVLGLDEPDSAKLRKTGVLELAPGNVVRRMHEKPQQPPSTLACPPLYFFQPSATQRLAEFLDDPRRNRDAAGYFIDFLCQRERVVALHTRGTRLAIGSLEDYRRADEMLHAG